MMRTMSSFSNPPRTSVMPMGRMLTALSEANILVAHSLMCSSPLAKPSLWAIHFLTLDTGSGEGMKRVYFYSSFFILNSSFLRMSVSILSRLPLAMMTVMPSSATLRAMLVLVSMPPRPKLDLEVCM